jgi:hypothetical protein
MVDMVDAICDSGKSPDDFARTMDAYRRQIVALLATISNSREFAEDFARTMEGSQIVRPSYSLRSRDLRS